MNSRNIRRHLSTKVNDWLNSIDDDNIKKLIEENLIISGGAIASLLSGETVKDYDCYFKTKEACYEVAKYYANKWNSSRDEQEFVEVLCDAEAISKCHLISDDYTIRCYINSSGVAGDALEEDDFEEDIQQDEVKKSKNKEKYRPIYFSSNAITLSDKIQIVVRFYGTVEELHKNFDYVHCTCSYDYAKDELSLPNKAIESILNKQLVYVGSRYPLCSIFRSKKYLKRGYNINAGQYLKMALQLNDLDLKNIDILRDQLIGVDSAYFSQLITSLESNEYDENCGLNTDYLMDLINEMFD